MNMILKIILIIFFLSLLLYPMLSSACSMCQSGYTAGQVTAYKQITLLLAVTPVLGGIFIFRWIYKKSQITSEK